MTAETDTFRGIEPCFARDPFGPWFERARGTDATNVEERAEILNASKAEAVAETDRKLLFQVRRLITEKRCQVKERIKSLLTRLVMSISEGSHATSAWLFVNEFDRLQSHVTHNSPRDPQLDPARPSIVISTATTIPWQVYFAGDVARDPNYLRVILSTQSEIAIPIVAPLVRTAEFAGGGDPADRLLGVLNLEYDDRANFYRCRDESSPSDLLKAVEPLVPHLLLYRFLNERQCIAAWHPDEGWSIDPLLHEMCSAITSELGRSVTHCSLWRAHREADSVAWMTIGTTTGYDDEYFAKNALRLNASFVGRVAEIPPHLVGRGAPADLPRFRRVDKATEMHVTEVASAPVYAPRRRALGESLGCLNLYSADKLFEVTFPSDETLLQLADYFGRTVVEFEEMRTVIAATALQQSIDDASPYNQSNIDAILTHLNRSLSADAALIFAASPAGEPPDLRVWSTSCPMWLDKSVTALIDRAEMALATQRRWNCDNAWRRQEEQRANNGSGAVERVLSAPIVFDGHQIGVVQVVRSPGKPPFANSDGHLLAALAEISAPWMQQLIETGTRQEAIVGSLSQQSDSLKGVLRRLHTVARDFGIRCLRFHVCDGDAKRLTSAAGEGQGAMISAYLGGGSVQRVLKTELSSDVVDESFACFTCREPVVVRINPHTTRPKRPYRDSRSGLTTIDVVTEPCKSLEGHKGKAWVDLPIEVAGRWVGKLSCDLDEPAGYDGMDRDIHEFWSYCQAAALALDYFYTKETCEPLDRSLAALLSCECVEAVFQKAQSLVQELVGECRISFYRFQVDALGSRQLVEWLANTAAAASPRRSRIVVDERSRLVNEDDCLAWVAHHREELLVEKEDGTYFNDQTLVLSDEFAISGLDGIQRGAQITSPLLKRDGELLGIVAIEQRGERPSDGLCGSRRVLVQRIVAQGLASRLVQLCDRDASDLALKAHQAVDSVAVCDMGSVDELLAAIGKVLESVVPEEGSRKVYLINVPEDDGQFRHWYTGGQLQHGNEPGEVLEFADSTMRQIFDSPDGFFHLADLDRALAQQASLRVYPQAVCSLGARIQFREKTYGALLVLSEDHDLNPEDFRPVLMTLAERTASLLAHRKMLAFSMRGLQKDVGDWVKQSRELIGQLRAGANPALVAAELERAAAMTDLALDATIQLIDPERSLRGCSRFSVRNTTDRVIAQLQLASCVHNGIDADLIVQGYESLFAMSIYKLLFHLLRSPLNSAVIAAEQDEELLRVVIRLKGERFTEQRLLNYLNANVVERFENWSKGRSQGPFRAVGLQAARSFARRHSFPGREVTFGVAGTDEGCEIRISLPIQTEHPSRHQRHLTQSFTAPADSPQPPPGDWSD
jgi:GAF domain-containing protein